MGTVQGTMKTAYNNDIKYAPFERRTQPEAAPLMNGRYVLRYVPQFKLSQIYKWSQEWALKTNWQF